MFIGFALARSKFRWQNNSVGFNRNPFSFETSRKVFHSISIPHELNDKSSAHFVKARSNDVFVPRDTIINSST